MAAIDKATDEERARRVMALEMRLAERRALAKQKVSYWVGFVDLLPFVMIGRFASIIYLKVFLKVEKVMRLNFKMELLLVTVWRRTNAN